MLSIAAPRSRYPGVRACVRWMPALPPRCYDSYDLYDFFPSCRAREARPVRFVLAPARQIRTLPSRASDAEFVRRRRQAR
jgi:hypothetical protein